MRKRLILSVLAVLVSGDAALADGFNYSYVQGNLLATQVKSNGDSDSGTGLRLEGAVANNQPLFGFFSFATNKYSADSDHLKFTDVSAGLGAHLPLGANLDVVGGISYESVKMAPHVSYSPRDTSAARGGIGLTAGLRGQFGEKIEWNAAVKYRDMEKIDPIVGITIGGHYLLTPAMSVGIDATGQQYDKHTLDATESIVALGLRYQFGSDR